MTARDATRLELSGQWTQAVALWTQLYAETHHPEAAIRLAFTCWYALAEPPHLLGGEPLSEEDLSAFQVSLQNVTSEALDRHADDPDVMFHIGYMATLFPYLFDSRDDGFYEWEARANDLLRRAHQTRPEDPVFEMVFLGTPALSISQQQAYDDACQRAAPVVAERYGSASPFDRYFAEVLSRV